MFSFKVMVELERAGSSAGQGKCNDTHCSRWASAASLRQHSGRLRERGLISGVLQTWTLTLFASVFIVFTEEEILGGPHASVFAGGTPRKGF